VIHAKETRHVLGVTPTATESGQAFVVTSVVEVADDPTAVMEVALMSYQLMECQLGSTSVEHP
jgi:hypothetical protein